MISMHELFPYFTNDGSVGLYNPDVDDIYHSTYGALSEAYEKFIIPANFEKYFKNNYEIKILDICYGIGYNSKSFLNLFLENFEKKFKSSKTNIATIDTDKIFNKISVTAIDVDKNLMFLSPFFKMNEKIKNNKIQFEHEKISGFLSKCTKPKYKYNKLTNFILLEKIIQDKPEILDDENLKNILSNRKYRQYFDAELVKYINFLRKNRINNSYLKFLSTFLHNIYYKYLSRRYKNAKKYLKIIDFDFKMYIDDARKVIQKDKQSYNFIFLDAFTPVKAPSLWTLDFFKLLHKKLDDTGIILTYSNSASVRNAFIKAGFWVGKIYNKKQDKFIGTIATKNLEFINHGLSEYDLGLIKSKAGIVYRDEYLNLSDNEIIEEHNRSVENSLLQSSSKFIRTFRGSKDV